MTPLQGIGMRLLFWIATFLTRGMLDSREKMELERIGVSLHNETGIFKTKEIPSGTISAAG